MQLFHRPWSRQTLLCNRSRVVEELFYVSKLFVQNGRHRYKYSKLKLYNRFRIIEQVVYIGSLFVEDLNSYIDTLSSGSV